MNERTTQRVDPVLLTTIALLVSFGLVMVYSASFPVAYRFYDSETYVLFRQLMWAVAGVVAMVAVLRVPYTWLRRLSVPLMFVTLVLLVLVLVLPEDVTVSNGAARWIRFGPVGIQPSEVAKMASIIYFADWLSKRGSKIRNLASLANFAVVLGLVAGLVLIEPDMGTTICIVLIGSAVIFASGASMLHLAAAGGMAVAAGWLAIHGASYRAARLLAYQDPWAYHDTIGYQPIHSLYALGSGGMFGEGLGMGRQKFEWLPFAHTDAIMAVIGEELGLVGSLLLVLGFVTIAFRGFRIAARLQDPFGSLLAVGITSWIVLQALLNVAVVSTLVPFTGVTLPFISYGGSSLTMTMVASAVLLNLSRHTAPRDVEEMEHAREFSVRELVAGLAYVPVALWRRNGGARVSSPSRRERAAEPGRSFAVGQPLSGTWRRRGSSQRPGPLGSLGARARARSRPHATAVRRERGWHGRADRRS